MRRFKIWFNTEFVRGGGERLCNTKLKGAKVPKIGVGGDTGEGGPSGSLCGWKGLGTAGKWRHAPLSPPSPSQPQMCFFQ